MISIRLTMPQYIKVKVCFIFSPNALAELSKSAEITTHLTGPKRRH